MRKLYLTLLAMLLCIAAAFPSPRVSARPAGIKPGHATGEVIIKLKQRASGSFSANHAEEYLTAARRIARSTGMLAFAEAEPLVSAGQATAVKGLIEKHGLDRSFVLKLSAGARMDTVISELEASGEIEYAEPNYRIKLGTLIPNDPRFFAQWSLRNEGFPIDGFLSTMNADIKAYTAWSVTTGSSDVVVALTDTGVDFTHPDLAANIYTNPGEVAGNGIDDDGNGYIDDVHGYNVAENNSDTTDIVGHGTQMAGVIAAQINNNIGIAGVAQCKVMPVRFFKRTGSLPEEFEGTVADAARALLYSIAAGAEIINASWQTLLDPEVVPEDGIRTLQEAVGATADAGALLVCIAGNEGFILDYSKVYPASYQLPNQIVVAASDYGDLIWHQPFYPYQVLSGTGQMTVHLAAPGVSVITTAARGDCISCVDSQDPEDWYVRADGTSISAATVSGVAALIKSLHPGDSGILLKRRILEGVEVVPTLEQYVVRGGRLSAAGALAAQVSVTEPAITRIKYKAGGGGKLTVFGSGILPGVRVIVGRKGYATSPKGSGWLARVPKAELPRGATVDIRVVNPDGGESPVLSFTR
jgi:subtilisin family serine protease